MRFQAGIQIVLIILSVVIATTVIRPEFDVISYKQDQIAEYNSAVARADQYNQHLQQMLNRVEGMTRTDQVALSRFLPGFVDTVRVARDIESIVKQHDLLLQKVAVVESDQPNTVLGRDNPEFQESALQSEALQNLQAVSFEVSAIGSYESFKAMLEDIERNAYPLRITSLSFISESDSLLLTYHLTLETYGLALDLD